MLLVLFWYMYVIFVFVFKELEPGVASRAVRLAAAAPAGPGREPAPGAAPQVRILPGAGLGPPAPAAAAPAAPRSAAAALPSHAAFCSRQQPQPELEAVPGRDSLAGYDHSQVNGRGLGYSFHLSRVI